MLDIKYYLILGRKGRQVHLIVKFNKNDCFHLMGLQYLKDRPQLKRDRGKIFSSFYQKDLKMSIFVVLFFFKVNEIIQEIRLHGLCYLRKKLKFPRKKKKFYMID